MTLLIIQVILTRIRITSTRDIQKLTNLKLLENNMDSKPVILTITITTFTLYRLYNHLYEILKKDITLTIIKTT